MRLYDSLVMLSSITSGFTAFINQASRKKTHLMCTLVINARQNEEIKPFETTLDEFLYNWPASNGSNHPLVRAYEVVLPFDDTEHALVQEIEESIRKYHRFPVDKNSKQLIVFFE